MKREKVEVLPTLSIESGFTGMEKAIIDVVKDVETKRFGLKTVIEITDEKTKERCGFFLNATSQNNLIDVFGSDDTNWIGNQIKLEVGKDKTYNKKMIVATALKGNEKVKE